MNLYPLKFKPILKPVIWGGNKICRFKGITPGLDGIGESWEISGIDGSISVVSNGTLQGENLEEIIKFFKGRLVGEHIYDRFGLKFPLLIKFIDARDNLSIQVHPDDDLARTRHGSFGKTEMWYVIGADKDAFLYFGFGKKIDPDIYEKSIADSTFTDYLAKELIKAGDVFLLPAGRVHAIGAGTFVAEIQQTSDTTYRIYDYNRKDAAGNTRELHTGLAKDAIDYRVCDNYRTEYKKEKNIPVLLESCNYFTTNLLDLNQETERDYHKNDSFIILICLEGDCSLRDNMSNEISLHKGETVLIPAETGKVQINPPESVLILETYIE